MYRTFSILEDPRHESYVIHRLEDVLTIVMCAVLCGMDDLCGIMRFAENRAGFLKDHFGIGQIPSKPTMSRILSMVDGKALGQIILSKMQERCGNKGDVIAVDGKAIRSTAKTNSRHTLQIVTAYLTEQGVVLAQEKIDKKTNEIPVFQEMLTYLNVKEKFITADALHCQRETCSRIVKKKGDYVFGLKENQKTLLEDVALFFEELPPDTEIETYETKEKNGGRQEVRVCRKADAAWLKKRHNWPGLRSILQVERIVQKGKRKTREIGYYISSSTASAEKHLTVVREHWKIESLHWMLDVVFSEDASRFYSENAHLTLNSFRKYALAIHKSYLAALPKKDTMKGSMINCMFHTERLVNVLSHSILTS